MSGGRWAKPQTAAGEPGQTEAERTEYLYGGLREIACMRCAAVVLAGKRSPKHTSVQWTQDPDRVCQAFNREEQPGCEWLRASIEAAADDGLFVEKPGIDKPGIEDPSFEGPSEVRA
ncbi:hypothetical protein [Sciscionella marina]|uniref:hypothetical protein n=1 Tax=Sciscionella marina TaxID=508770 RepID=UPI000365C6B2|nr:hypothetical protein [Sciscionella marina]